MKSFQEYVNSRGKIAKPIIKADGDITDPKTMPTKPPHGNPYKNNKTPKKATKGFGDEGDSKLRYMPCVKNGKGKAPAKIPTVEQAQIAAKISKQLQQDPSLTETIVRQLKNDGVLGLFVAELFEHRETYKQISEVMAHKVYGPQICEKLVKAMHEEVAKPFSDQLDDQDFEEDEPLENSDQEDGEGIDDSEFEDDLDFGDNDIQNMGNDEDELSFDDEDGMENQNGMDPNMDMNSDPNMEMGNDPLMSSAPAVQNFHRAMMRSYQNKMMSKQ